MTVLPSMRMVTMISRHRASDWLKLVASPNISFILVTLAISQSLHCKQLAPHQKSLLKLQNTIHAPNKHHTTTSNAPTSWIFHFRCSFSKIACHNLGIGMFSRTFPVRAICTVFYGTQCYYTVCFILFSRQRFISFTSFINIRQSTTTIDGTMAWYGTIRLYEKTIFP